MSKYKPILFRFLALILLIISLQSCNKGDTVIMNNREWEILTLEELPPAVNIIFAISKEVKNNKSIINLDNRYCTIYSSHDHKYSYIEIILNDIVQCNLRFKQSEEDPPFILLDEKIYCRFSSLNAKTAAKIQTYKCFDIRDLVNYMGYYSTREFFIQKDGTQFLNTLSSIFFLSLISFGFYIVYVLFKYKKDKLKYLFVPLAMVVGICIGVSVLSLQKIRIKEERKSLLKEKDWKGKSKEMLVKVIGKPDSISDNQIHYLFGERCEDGNAAYFTFIIENGKVMDAVQDCYSQNN